MALWVKYKDERFVNVEEFRAYAGNLPEPMLYRCAYDIAFGRDIIGTPADYPDGHSYRQEWERRFERAGMTGIDAFDRALEIAADITLPPADKLTADDLRGSAW